MRKLSKKLRENIAQKGQKIQKFTEKIEGNLKKKKLSNEPKNYAKFKKITENSKNKNKKLGNKRRNEWKLGDENLKKLQKIKIKQFLEDSKNSRKKS